MNVNFILTSGELGYSAQRAIRTAAIHGGPVTLWHVGEKPYTHGLEVECRRLMVPPFIDLPKAGAHLFDLLAYMVGYCSGGLVLGLDTISIRSAADLLSDGVDVVLSTDWPDEDLQWRPDPWNNNFIGRRGSPFLKAMMAEAGRRIQDEPEVWGYTGPLMLTQFVKSFPGRVIGAPYPALCGLAPGYIWRFILGLEAPGPNVRVIHLCQTAYRDILGNHVAAERWAAANPSYAWAVEQRTDLNEHYFNL